jgi:hypothetical protein
MSRLHGPLGAVRRRHSSRGLGGGIRFGIGRHRSPAASGARSCRSPGRIVESKFSCDPFLSESTRDVFAERWIIKDLAFLELSIRSETVADALPAHEELEREVRALNLQPDQGKESKTERVLTHLVGQNAATL